MVGGSKNIYTLARKIVKHLEVNLQYDTINKEGLKGWNGKERSYLVLKT